MITKTRLYILYPPYHKPPFLTTPLATPPSIANTKDLLKRLVTWVSFRSKKSPGFVSKALESPTQTNGCCLHTKARKFSALAR